MDHFTLAILDTETTGLDPHDGHRVIEFGAVKVREGKVLDNTSLNFLINPERGIAPAAAAVSGISDAEVATAPTFAEVLPDIAAFLDGADIVVAHNASFDRGFLEHEFSLAAQPLPSFRWLCSRDLSKKLLPELARYDLDRLTRHFSLSLAEGEGRHRALGDVLLTADLLFALRDLDPVAFDAELGAPTSALRPAGGLFG